GMIAVVFTTETAGGARPMRPRRGTLRLACGFLIPVLPVAIYMATRGALGAMVTTLAFGPGEFLINRLSVLPSASGAVLVFALIGCVALLSHRLKNQPGFAASSLGAMVVVTIAGVLLLRQSLLDGVIFYAPVFVVLAGAAAVWKGRWVHGDRSGLLALVIVAASAFMETFPRFAREQAVASMPFVALLIVCLSVAARPAIVELLGGIWRYRVAISILPLMLFLLGARLCYNVYFSGPFRFRSETELSI